MVGHGVLRACLLDPDVEVVLTVGRTATGVQNPKLREIVHPDLFHYEGIESELAGFDACFFCLGQTSYGMTEEDYERVTYGITMAVEPGRTACFKCIYPEPPTGVQPTCETAGVLGAVTATIASLQVSAAMRIMCGWAR